MKKIFSLLAMGAIVCGMTSCSNEAPEGQNANCVTVEYNLVAPGMNTRTYGDGTTVDQLSYLVLDESSKVIFNSKKDAFADNSLTDKVSFNLVKGKTYTVVFWADVKGNPYYLFNTDGTLNVNYLVDTPANDENRDAFFACDQITVTENVSKDFHLYRPFAQINVGTTAEDYAAAVAAKVNVVKSGLKIQTYGTLNLISGEVSNPTIIDIVHDATPVPNKTLGATPSTDLSITLEDNTTASYVWLSMNYVLVGAEKEVVNVVTMTTDGVTEDKVFGSIPVQRNYRTNIIGNLLTSNYEYNVILEPEFKQKDYNEIK